ncbi:ADP-ribose pyrophosphatase [Gottschalkia purinilytica]|uniref:ADP-ribose pyrophosphatase n=1 Tax=Gottschalkia purinilytica TaxID=1503 RepID=A0A0L0WDJ4_GOTPU|nr:NUDIX domain-containing protein [Gottschalkia purinilytica]KNF09547.1 ADP-ribose pyrophosphatase [Gottschalkia purinilytica]
MFRIVTKALVFKGNEILILKRASKSKFGKDLWDIPGGKLNFGEEPLEGLLREIYEETSLSISPKSIIDVSSGIDNEKGIQYVTITYLCDYVSGEVRLNDENKEFAWANIKNMKDYNKMYYLEQSLDKYLKSL